MPSSGSRPASPTFAAGDLIAGRYRVARFLDAGGMGEVYEVEDQDLGDVLALKTVRRDAAEENAADASRRFEQEIRFARKVTHRNVCRVFDAGRHALSDGGTLLYLTMELLEGETLAERIDRVGALPVDQALPIVRQLARALDAAHREGVVHQDFKSGNILLVPDGDGERAVVTDFGLAAAVGAERRTEGGGSGSALSGTVAFIAPEQIEGTTVGPETDLYSLGIVIYQMVTGDVPFRASTPLGTAVKRLREPPEAPAKRAPGLPARWNDTILRCLEIEARRRFRSGLEVVEALEGSRWVGRALHLRLAITGGVAVLAVGAWFLFAPAGEDPVEPGPRAADEPVQWTTEPGLEIDPAFSPDGSALVFASDRGGAFELVVRSLAAGGTDLELTSDGFQNVQPAWSPDGTTIAYTSLERGGIFLVPSGGGAARRLTDFGGRPAWSPDGSRLVFQEETRHEVAERSLPALAPSRLFTVPASGGEALALTTSGAPEGGHGEPAWTADGRWIVFSSSSRRRSGIWAVRADGKGEPGPVVTDARIALHPRPLADGSGLLWVGVAAEREGAASYALWWGRWDPETGTLASEPRRLEGLGLATLRQPAPSRDGSRVVWSTLRTSSQLWSLEVDADGLPVGPPAALTAGSNRNSRPQWSPDSSRIAFDRWQVGTNLDIWTLDPASGESVQVTIDPGWDSQATWLADGRIAWFSDRGGSRAVWVSDPDRRAAAPLDPAATFDSELEWARTAPDGRRIAFHRRGDGGGLDVWIRELPSGAELQLTEDPEMAAFPVWSADGRWIAFEIRRDGSTHVCVVPAAGGEIEQVTDEAGESWPFGFSPDGDRVLYSALRDTVWSLRWVSRSTGATGLLVEEHRLGAYVRYPAWSPTGDRIVYELSETSGDLWTLQLTSDPESSAGS